MNPLKQEDHCKRKKMRENLFRGTKSHFLFIGFSFGKKQIEHVFSTEFNSLIVKCRIYVSIN